MVAIAQRQMGESFRIGIDDAKTALVSRGLFRRVRNPIYSGLLALLFGVALRGPLRRERPAWFCRGRRRSRSTPASRSAICSSCTATPIARTPLLLVVFAGVLLVWPVVRLRRETGVQALTLHRNTTPGNRFDGARLPRHRVGLAALVRASRCSGRTLGVWAAPRGLVLAGMLLCAAGVVVIAIAQRQMGASFRIGIDDAKTALVSRGLFRRVRNPIYSGLLGMLLGVTLVIPCVASLLLGAAGGAAIAIHTRLEERHCSRCTATPIARTPPAVGRFVPGNRPPARVAAPAPAPRALACRLVLDPTREGVSATDWAAATAGCHALRVRCVIDETSDARSLVLEIPAVARGEVPLPAGAVPLVQDPAGRARC